MDGTGNYHGKQNKPYSKREISVFPSMLLNRFFLKFVFVVIECSVYIFVSAPCIYIWCQRSSEEGIGSSGTGVTVMRCYVCFGSQSMSARKETSALTCWVISPDPLFYL